MKLNNYYAWVDWLAGFTYKRRVHVTIGKVALLISSCQLLSLSCIVKTVNTHRRLPRWSRLDQSMISCGLPTSKPFLIISVKSRNEWSVCINLGFRSFRRQVGSAQVVPTQVDPAPSRSDPKLKVDSAPLEIKYFWTEIHKCLSFQNVFERF